MKKVMFICTGNICRSAMALGVMKKKLEELGRKDVEIYSCGMDAEDGQAATYNTIAAMKKYDINIEDHKATNIKNSNIEDMDIILCATRAHRDKVRRLYPKLNEKIFTLKEYVKYDRNNQDLDIENPWGYDMETYIFCAKQIWECVNLLINII